MAIYRGTGGSAEATTNATVNEVAGYAVDAETSATNAASSASSAASSATSSSGSATASASSATASESYATASASSASVSSASASNAATSASQAASSASAASTSASNASTSETNAASSETAAASSASNAATSATNANTSASNASTSETNAATSASNASTSETNAATSASEAAASAASIVSDELESAANAAAAAQSYDNFDDRYLGAKASDPTVDNDGDALITGAMYFDSSNNVMKVYSGTEWQNASSSIEGIKSDFVYTATASQVLFSGADDNTDTLVIDKAGLVNVYLNGVRLTDADYTINTTGNSVTLGSGATVGDIVEIEVFGNFAGQSGADVAITGGSITGLTELSTGTFTSTGIDDNATSTAITIDASENVGIGTASPNISGFSRALTIDSSESGIELSSSGTVNTLIASNAQGANIQGIGSSGIRLFTSASGSASERARIDSSGNLLVGKTNDLFATTGSYMGANGVNEMTTSGTHPLRLNRKGSWGDLHTLSVDGTEYGKLGLQVTTPYFSNSTTGGIALGTVSGATAVVGCATSGVLTDASHDLGASNVRWRDLYLSGGVYLGGTGAANKLDSYEEGVWTPTSGVSLSMNNLAKYVKIGSLVHISFDFTVGTSSSGAEFMFTTPFAHESSYYGTGPINYTTATSVGSLNIDGTSGIKVRDNLFNSNKTYSAMSGNRLIGNITYRTTA